jgi:GH43 family beta-xylosidase
MAAAELNDDMTSLKMETLRVLTPSPRYNEGSYVFYRKGKYYFTWSENDTRDPNYCVRYGVSTGPLEKITLPSENLVLFRNDEAKIYGTGHHAVIQIPGTDKWYIVYHRFTHPKGIAMGRSAGYHREVCIDELRFNDDGGIQQVKVTHAGIAPLNK